MSQQEQADSPFEAGPESADHEDLGEPEQQRKAFDMFGLRNSQPAISPRDVGRELDLDVEWYQHLFVGFMKQSDSDGAEAWMHHVIAMILLADTQYHFLSEGERDELESEQPDEWDDDRV
jgi:hypothetical protein